MPNWNFTWYDRVDRVGEAIAGVAPNTTTIVNLSAPPFKTMFRTFTGDAPPFRPINENVPLTPGSYLKFVQTEENEVDLVVLIQGSSREALYNIMAGAATNGVSLANIFSPIKPLVVSTLLDPPAGADTQRDLTGFGKLRVTTPANTPNGGVTRDLICRCISGFKIREQDLQIASAFVPLTFYANDPFWRGSTLNSFDMGRMVFPPSVLPVPPPWFQYLDGINVGAGATYEKNFVVTNGGDASAPPIWTVRGPGSAPYFRNLTTGKTLQFPTLQIGKLQDLVINVENRTVQISGVAGSLLRTISVSSEFWEFITGPNKITVRLFNGGPGYNVNSNTRVKIEYYDRFMGVY